MKTIAALLRAGAVGVLPTDTLYGLVGSAFSKKAVRRVYKLKKRNEKKPLIILIASVVDLKRFGIRLGTAERSLFRRVWPGAVSVVLPVTGKRFLYLHRGTSSLAFRLPRLPWLAALLRKTGPLVAPSANPEGKLPARTGVEAERYFGDRVDFYFDDGLRRGRPSTVVRLKNGTFEFLRKGAGRLKA